jgi:HlyD family type I secretion membrane fusion protein
MAQMPAPALASGSVPSAAPTGGTPAQKIGSAISTVRAAASDLVPKRPTNVEGAASFGYAVIGAVFLFFFTWSYFADLSSAVIASGVVAPESNRKTIQHLEGGIVEEILVREADRVVPGQPLVRMLPVQARANADILGKQFDSLLALEARHRAEMDRAEAIAFPEDLLARARENPETAAVLNDQRNQFRERRASFMNQLAILEARIQQTDSEISGFQSQEAAVNRQLMSLTEEIAKIRSIAEKGLFPMNRLNQLSRDRDVYEGKLGEVQSAIARARKTIGETNLQIDLADQKLQEEAAQGLRDVRIQIGDMAEKLRVARDVLSRIELKAPIAGVVQNIRVHTVGGVLKPGEAVMDLVPIDDDLVVTVRVSPFDVSHLHTGLEAEVRFPTFKSRQTPVIFGRVEAISADSMVDERNPQGSFYQARVRVDPAKLPEELRGKLTPGMPADVIVATESRTVLQYLVKPFYDSIHKSFREY